MTDESTIEQDVRELAGRLQTLQERLGPAYWQSGDVRELQSLLKSRIGMAGGHDPDGPPMHARSRRAARWESEFARLLWPW